MQNRRGFLKGAFAAAASTVVPRAFATKPALSDEYTALLADTHISGLEKRVAYSGTCLERRIADILRRDPLPKRVVVFGDIAYLYGKRADYVKAAPYFKLLTDLGIEVTYGLGNHDRREPFWEVFAGEAGKSPVKNRQIAVASPVGVDLLMLDSLDQPPTDERWISPGDIGGEQGEWLLAELPKWKRPVLVCAHHPLSELKAGGEPLVKLLCKSQNVVGFVHGHNHFWKKNVYENWGGVGYWELLRSVSLPCTGLYGDIGYAWMHSSATCCRIDNVESDCYFNAPVPKERRQLAWDSMLKENTGDYIEFHIPRRRT